MNQYRDQKMPNGDDELSELFHAYRDACPHVEASADFMPDLWRRIEQRQDFWFLFGRLGRPLAAACAALCLFLVLLNVSGASASANSGLSYVDQLVRAQSPEQTYFAGALAPVGVEDSH